MPKRVYTKLKHKPLVSAPDSAHVQARYAQEQLSEDRPVAYHRYEGHDEMTATGARSQLTT